MKKVTFLIITCFCFVTDVIIAQTNSNEGLTVEEMAKKRQDPVSGLRSVFLQEVLLPVADGTAQSFSIQPVWPFRLAKNLKLITYTIIPFQSVPITNNVGQVPVHPITLQSSNSDCSGGLGNILFNGYFSSIEKKGKISWGAGPAIQLPTRTNAILGSNRVSLGPSVLFNRAGDIFSIGFVAQNYWSLGGEGANKVNSFSLQYMSYYNLPKGWFLESNATIVNNWLAEKDQKMLLPLGGGAGKTFKIGQSKLFYCGAAQIFYNAVRPDIVGSWQAMFQLQVIM
ncbi:hypothetical protein [Flavobacterium agrisoli]|uniref:Neuromedin U n=1 Tax=Flavobacterium agrisoli TaxID=2793066 RepID=A0A934PND7_9FLAO|nr:hypothetical protein [Flavobacterium agrisoli]MBK0370055.1 hypothetical protein [Flavobacterium agrisoli]